MTHTTKPWKRWEGGRGRVPRPLAARRHSRRCGGRRGRWQALRPAPRSSEVGPASPGSGPVQSFKELHEFPLPPGSWTLLINFKMSFTNVKSFYRKM